MRRGVALAVVLAVGLVNASIGVSSAGVSGFSSGKLVVQAMHTRWPDGSPVESGGENYPTDIYVVDVNGRHMRNLTHDASTNYLLDGLPDSQRILYESVPSDRMRPGPSRIFSIKADGGGRRQLASGRGARISPDKQRVMFLRGRWLYVMRSDGSQRRPLAQTNFGYYVPYAGPYDADWSPDGRRIAFVRGFAERQSYGGPFHPRSAIYVINADGTGLRQLTKVRQEVVAMNPAWSSDGRKIAFTEHSYETIATTDRTYVMRQDGTDRRRIKQLEGANWFWLPNGRIAYDDGGPYKSVDADGTGKPTALSGRIRIGDDLLIVSGPSAGFWPVSPDEKRIALYRGARNLWIAHLDGTHRRLVTRKICCLFEAADVAWVG